MRKVTQQIADAFMARKAKTIGNTHTDGESIWLHGNEIVRRNESDEIEISLAGWPTVTTRERLKPFANVCQRKGEQYLNGKQIEDLRGWNLAVPVNPWEGIDAADYYKFMGVKPERVKEIIAAAKQQAANKTKKANQ